MAELMYHLQCCGDKTSAVVQQVTTDINIKVIVTDVTVHDFRTNGDDVMFEQRVINGGDIRTIVSTSAAGVVFLSYNSHLKFVNFTNRHSVLMFDDENHKLYEVMHKNSKWLHKPVTTYDIVDVVTADVDHKHMWVVTRNGSILMFSALDQAVPRPSYVPAGFQPVGVVSGIGLAQAIVVARDSNNTVQFLRYEVLDDAVVPGEVMQPVQTVMQFFNLVMGSNCCAVMGTSNGKNLLMSLFVNDLDFKLSEVVMPPTMRATQIVNNATDVLVAYLIDTRGYGHMVIDKSSINAEFPAAKQMPDLDKYDVKPKALYFSKGLYNVDAKTPLVSTVVVDTMIDKQRQNIDILTATARACAQGENGSSFTKGKVAELRNELNQVKREQENAVKALQELHAVDMGKLKSELACKEMQMITDMDNLKKQLALRPTQKAMERQKQLLVEANSDVNRLKAQLEAEKKKVTTMLEHMATTRDDMAGMRAQVASLSARLQDANELNANTHKQQVEFTRLAKQLTVAKTNHMDEIKKLKGEHAALVLALKQEHDAVMQKEKTLMLTYKAETAARIMNLETDLSAVKMAPAPKETKEAETMMDDDMPPPLTVVAQADDTTTTTADGQDMLTLLQTRVAELEANNTEVCRANVAFMHHTRDLETKLQGLFAQNQELKHSIETGGRYTKQAYAGLQTEIDTLRKANRALTASYSTLTTMTKFGFLPNGTKVDTAMEMIHNLMEFQEDAGRLRSENVRLTQELDKIKAIVSPTM